MKNSYPLVSVGLPVYNGERTLREAIDSLLAQDYANFELIISDNASIDHTPEICLQYASKDKRIRYYKNNENKGASSNFLKVLQLSRGEYFMWAAHDKWEKFYISELVECLETLGPKFVAASFEAQYMDVAGNKFEFFAEGTPFYDYQSDDQFGRIKHMLQYNYGNIIYSLYRRETLQEKGLLFVENEIPFLLQIIQRGNWQVLPRVGFHKRTVLPTYKQARWERQGGYLKDASYSNGAKNLLRGLINLRQSWPYHQLAIQNIRRAIDTLMINRWQRTQLKIFAGYVIWGHLIQLSMGYKRKPF
jgi:glycosyltransferase involved in cell wall biosynthesis